MKSWTCLFATGILVSSLAFGETRIAASAEKDGSNNASTELVAQEMTTVHFPKGGSMLSEAEALNIRAVYKRAQTDSTVSRIIVAGWSDREWKAGETLPENQIHLADKRTLAVKKVLGEMGNKPVETFNMARAPHWLAKALGSADAEVKTAVGNATADVPAGAKGLAAAFVAQGGPGRAVVIVERVTLSGTTSGR